MSLRTPTEVSQIAFVNALDPALILPEFIASASTKFIVPVVTQPVLDSIDAVPADYTLLINCSYMPEAKLYDVIIVGGSYAGLSAAMTLGRSLRDVLIIDNGQPCNRQTPNSHNFITQDGEKPGNISAKARAQVLNYKTVELMDGLATYGARSEDGFIISTEDGRQFNSKKLIIATGIKDQMPGINGFAECWGISIIHCPYCHGYEFRGQKTALMANGHMAMHLVSLVHNLSKDLKILTNGAAEFSSEEEGKLNHHNIEIIEKEILKIDNQKGKIDAVIFSDGTKESFAALYAVIPFSQHSDIPELLGCDFTANGHISVNVLQQTNITGVYACGDSTSPMRSVANAVYSGNMAGAAVNKELAEEEF